jgi:DNA-binding NarL/FixJ family response regulator
LKPTTILLVEDHQLVREALSSLLERDSRFKVVGQAKNGSEALDMTAALRPDVVLMDIMMPHLHGIEATARLTSMADAPLVLILSQYSAHEYVVKAIQSGAKGYLLKDAAADELLRAIEIIQNGELYLSRSLPRAEILDSLERKSSKSPLDDIDRLTGREREVLQLVAEGNTNRQIAKVLGISIKTVEKHRFSLMDKLNVRDITALVRFAVSRGVIRDDSHPSLP